MKQLSAVTCVTFKKRTTETDYVYYYYGGTGCNSRVGRHGGKHVINLKPGVEGKSHPCAHSAHTVVHETMHALGCHHEMSRPDRDDYVTIVRDNIKPGRCNGVKWTFIHS